MRWCSWWWWWWIYSLHISNCPRRTVGRFACCATPSHGIALSNGRALLGIWQYFSRKRSFHQRLQVFSFAACSTIRQGLVEGMQGSLKACGMLCRILKLFAKASGIGIKLVVQEDVRAVWAKGRRHKLFADSMTGTSMGKWYTGPGYRWEWTSCPMRAECLLWEG